MKLAYHIKVKEFCLKHEVEESFIDTLLEYELITVKIAHEEKYVSHEELSQLERMVRMYRELGVNPEGIQIIQQLLNKIERHQHELQKLRNRLSRFEDF
ncbi:chaperone modulator CbpM [Ascidiimonas sp. W6]|uniref:chaperone modulator CbpM n=1 Tax=Ascidiimonas meishanensis TaxID=3128903 RepID=UPI0030EB3181